MKLISQLMLFLMFILTISISSCAQDKSNVNLPKLIDLGAHKCLACQKMAPVIDSLKKEYKGKLIVEFIDVGQQENQEKARQYGIRVIPTQIFFDKNGKEIWRHEGYILKDEILAKFLELGVDFGQKVNRKLGDTNNPDDHFPDGKCCK